MIALKMFRVWAGARISGGLGSRLSALQKV